MKKLVSVSNTGDGHLSLQFEGYAPRKDVGFKTFDRGMIIMLGDENTEDIHEVEVLFVGDEGRIRRLIQVAEMYELDLSPPICDL